MITLHAENPGVAGGASESTNVILSRTRAFVDNSRIGSAAQSVGKLDLDADAIAASYLHVLRQPRSTWTWELDLRPWVERF